MNCPVCLSPSTSPSTLVGSDVLFETTTRAFSLSGCSACRCLFIDPLPGDKEIAGFYPAQYWWKASAGILKSLEGAYRKMALRDHVAFVSNAAPRRDSSLLDVGCGSGTLLGLLKERGFQVRGFDFSAEAAAIAKSENGVDVVVGSRLQDAGFEDESFDLVTLFHVMEHVTDPRTILSEVRRILRPAGRLVLQVPNIESWQFRLFGVRWYGLDVPRHVVNYSNRAMQRLLADSGFKVRRTRHFNLRDNAPALASSLFPSLDPVSRSVRQRRRNHAEPAPLSWLRHALYLGVVVAAQPFAIAESAAGRGATIMVEAEKVA
jgi:2-polyprenyl-3-methyl-5-hydroxy-6-metoxy-1,4-benzoquinol methylase